MSLHFDLHLGELQLPKESGKDGEEERGEGDSEEDEGREGRRQWPDAVALRAWPHPEPQGSGHTLSTHSSPAASRLSPVTSVQQATREIHECPAHPWPLPKRILLPAAAEPQARLQAPAPALDPSTQLPPLGPDTADGSQTRSQAIDKSRLLSLFPL